MGDRNYRSPNLAEPLGEWVLRLLAYYESKKREREPRPRWLTQKRRRIIEMVISQLVGRYRGKRVWARDRWHLTSRWSCKVLSHTGSVFLRQEEIHLPSLRFAEPLTKTCTWGLLSLAKRKEHTLYQVGDCHWQDKLLLGSNPTGDSPLSVARNPIPKGSS